ncbi:MAG: DUF1453 family protein [Chloroflexi bacterium]|nr:DUF1453 family protein [Chloroflexota bacterium]
MKVLDLTNPLIDLGGLLLIGVLLALQLRRRKVSIKRLWVVPVVITGLSLFHLARNVPEEWSVWGLLAAAFIGGLVIGFVRAQLVDIQHVDPRRGVLLVQSSLLGVLVWFAVFVARVVLRQVVSRSGPDASTINLVTGCLLVLAAGSVLANAIWTYRLYARTGVITQFS